jgi:hypothetical protein
MPLARDVGSWLLAAFLANSVQKCGMKLCRPVIFKTREAVCFKASDV